MEPCRQETAWIVRPLVHSREISCLMSFLGILLMLSYYFIIDLTHVLVLAGCNWALPGNYSYFSFLKEWRAYSVMLTTSFVWIPFTWYVWLVKNCSQSDDFSLPVSVEVSLSRCSPLQMLSWCLAVFASPLAAADSPRGGFFSAHVLLMVMSFPLGVLGCCRSRGALWNGAMLSIAAL